LFGDGDTSHRSSPAHRYKDTGDYEVMLVANPHSRCADTLKKTIRVEDAPKAAFEYALDSCTGVITFVNHSRNARTVTWNFGDNSSSDEVNPVHIYQNAATYHVMLVADSGSICADTARLNIEIPQGSAIGQIKTYNVFTPNHDGYNDAFEIKGLANCRDYELFIYNRWGQLMYHKTGNSFSWDGSFMGEEMKSGTYFFVLGAGRKPLLTGTVDLIR
jgi:gliding motility-associated-like protein